MSAQKNQIPARVGKIFGKPPILAGEDAGDYDELMQMVIADVKPEHMHEWLLVKDIVDSEWELLRLRILKLAMVHVMVPRAINEQLRDTQALVPADAAWAPGARQHLRSAVQGDPQAYQQFDALFTQHGLTMELATAAAFGATLREQVQTERMVQQAYERRNAAYAELERVRAKRAGTGPSREMARQDQIVAAPSTGTDPSEDLLQDPSWAELSTRLG